MPTSSYQPAFCPPVSSSPNPTLSTTISIPGHRGDKWQQAQHVALGWSLGLMPGAIEDAAALKVDTPSNCGYHAHGGGKRRQAGRSTSDTDGRRQLRGTQRVVCSRQLVIVTHHHACTTHTHPSTCSRCHTFLIMKLPYHPPRHEGATACSALPKVVTSCSTTAGVNAATT